MMTSPKYFYLVVLLSTTLDNAHAQCTSYKSGEINFNDVMTGIFNSSPKNVTDTMGCLGGGPYTETLCVYELQAPTGHVIDFNIITFIPLAKGTLSLIDGRGIFGGTYFRTETAAIPAQATDNQDGVITSTVSNIAGMVVNTRDGGMPTNLDTIQYYVVYKMRKSSDPVMTLQEALVLRNLFGC